MRGMQRKGNVILKQVANRKISGPRFSLCLVEFYILGRGRYVSLLHLVFLTEEVLANILNGVFGLVLGQLFERLNERWHDVLVEVLTNGEVGVHGFLLHGLAHVSGLIVRVYFYKREREQGLVSNSMTFNRENGSDQGM